MMPSPQRVRTSGAPRPRNLAVGCFAVLVVLAALWLLGRVLRSTEADVPTPPASVEAPAP